MTFASTPGSVKDGDGNAMKRIVAICLAGAALAACTTDNMGGPSPVGPPPPSSYQQNPPGAGFEEGAFAWSRGAAGGGIRGVVTYGGASYTCGDVVLLPETPWTRARMERLYGSSVSAVIPVDDVRARTPHDANDIAQSRSSATYARHAQCDPGNHFRFDGLPNGAWYIITVATPRGGGPKIALMKRFPTYGFVDHTRLP
jgi:hypothetical protein